MFHSSMKSTFSSWLNLKFPWPVFVCACVRVLKPGHWSIQWGRYAHGLPLPSVSKFFHFHALPVGWHPPSSSMGYHGSSTAGDRILKGISTKIEFNTDPLRRGQGVKALAVVKIVREKAGLKSWPDTRFHFHCSPLSILDPQRKK